MIAIKHAPNFDVLRYRIGEEGYICSPTRYNISDTRSKYKCRKEMNHVKRDKQRRDNNDSQENAR